MPFVCVHVYECVYTVLGSIMLCAVLATLRVFEQTTHKLHTNYTQTTHNLSLSLSLSLPLSTQTRSERERESLCVG